MGFKKHHELEEKYEAIDGISKGDRDFHPEDTVGGRAGVFYKPSQRPIRSDIEEILLKDKEEFNSWIEERRNATEALLRDYKLFVSIPDLSYGSEQHKFDMSAKTHVKDHLNSLKKGLDYLNKLEQVYLEIHNQDKP